MGLFWSLPVDPRNVQVDLQRATATMWGHNYGIQDFGNLSNALHRGSSEQANIAFHVRWRGARKRVHEVNKEQGYEARLVHTDARIRWRAVQSGFTFLSDPKSESENVFSQIGHEQNGVFFSG